MEGERSIALLCWYFRSVLIYIIAAFVVSLVGQPVMRALRRFRIKGRSAPDWLLAAIPAYTVIRVIASRFFYHWKPVRRLIPDREEAAEESGEEAEMGRS